MIYLITYYINKEMGNTLKTNKPSDIQVVKQEISKIDNKFLDFDQTFPLLMKEMNEFSEKLDFEKVRSYCNDYSIEDRLR